MGNPLLGSIFGSLYHDDRDRRNPLEAINDFLKPPAIFQHCKEELVAEIPQSQPGGDGHAVEVYECRMPARFYTLVVLPSRSSTGKEKPGWTVSTGSGDDMGRLIAQLALAVAAGMIGFHPPESK